MAAPVADPAGEEPPAEAGEVLSLLWRANHELELLSKRMIRTLGVTGPQRMVLRIVGRRPGISATGICDTARIHPSTLTGILERLARGGFLARSRDTEDGRRARLQLTPKGSAVADTSEGTVESAMVTSLAALTPEERRAVQRWLSAFADALGAERGKGGEGPAAGGLAPAR